MNFVGYALNTRLDLIIINETKKPQLDTSIYEHFVFFFLVLNAT
jgi:hypothetical protein